VAEDLGRSHRFTLSTLINKTKQHPSSFVLTLFIFVGTEFNVGPDPTERIV